MFQSSETGCLPFSMMLGRVRLLKKKRQKYPQLSANMGFEPLACNTVESWDYNSSAAIKMPASGEGQYLNSIFIYKWASRVNKPLCLPLYSRQAVFEDIYSRGLRLISMDMQSPCLELFLATINGRPCACYYLRRPQELPLSRNFE